MHSYNTFQFTVFCSNKFENNIIRNHNMIAQKAINLIDFDLCFVSLCFSYLLRSQDFMIRILSIKTIAEP